MDLTKIYMSTLIPQMPKIIDDNFTAVENYIDGFYDASSNVLTRPLTTTGRVKGAKGEFVNIQVDNLTVKKQFTNLYDNITTADYDFYTTVDGSAFVTRDASTEGSLIENGAYQYITVTKPYYKVTNEYPIALANDNLSQVVGIYFDPSLVGVNDFQIVLDPCVGTKFSVDSSSGAGSYSEFILTGYDVSWGGIWSSYKNEAVVNNNPSKTTVILAIDTGDVEWDYEANYNAKLTMTSDASLDITGISDGDSGTMIIIQDATGSRLLTLPAGSLKNEAWDLSTDPNAIDILSFMYDGTSYYWNKGGAYA